MNTLEIKNDFHSLIDSIDNENLLSEFYAMIKRRISATDGKLWKGLTKKELEELNLAFEESKKPENLINHEEMIKKTDYSILQNFRR